MIPASACLSATRAQWLRHFAAEDCARGVLLKKDIALSLPRLESLKIYLKSFYIYTHQINIYSHTSNTIEKPAEEAATF